MKQILAAMICAWLSVMLELAFADVLPRGALLLPVLCAVLTWRASVRLLLTGGILLLTDWIARPTLLPLVPLLLPFAVLLVLPDAVQRSYDVRVWLRLPTPLQVPLLTILAAVLQSCSGLSWQVAPTAQDLLQLFSQHLSPLLLVAVPVSAVLALLLRLAEELGLRRAFAAEFPRL